MASLLSNRRFIAWTILIAASFLSFESSSQGGTQTSIVIAAIIGIAVFKAGVIGYEYMELKDEAVHLRLIFTAWMAIVGGTLAFLL